MWKHAPSVAVKKAVLGAAIAAFIANSQAYAQVAEEAYAFDIAGQTLTQALKSYAQTTNQQIIFTEDLVTGHNAPTVQGTYSAGAALERLLKGTGLTVEKSPSGAIMIRKPGIESNVIGNVLNAGDSGTGLRFAQADERTQSTSGTYGSGENPPVESEELQLEVVTVTARKMKESLQQVPLSVVAASGEELERRSIENLAALGQSTPNFQFAETPQSGRLGGVAFIRGVGQRDPIAAYDPAVGVYIDGVYFGRMFGNNLDMMDIERVEVLRGPQGTLFGKNTSGGAINIVSLPPDASAGALSGRIQATTGNRDRFDVLGSVNIPLAADRLALRLAASRLRQDGYGHRLDGQDMGNMDRDSIRAQLLIQPAEAFSALLAADYTQFDETNASFKLAQVNTLAGAVAAYNANRDPDYDSRWISSGNYFSNATGPNSSRGHLWGASLTLDFDTDWAALKSISAYREMNAYNDLDPDGAPIVIINQFQAIPQHQISQELQLTGAALDERLNWVMGAYYFHEIAEDNPSYNLVSALFGTARDFSRSAHIENDSRALYAQGAYNLTDRLRLTAGLRYTDDQKDVTVDRTGFSPFGPLTGEHDSTSVSPRLGFDYQWTPDVMTYVSVSQGARNGGFTGRPGIVADFVEFDDETVWTYEAGVRSEFFDRRARVNATVFYSRFEDLQLQVSGTIPVGNPPSPQPFAIIANIPKSSIRGGELELAYIPTEHWSFSGALGLTDARYDELPTDPRFVAFVASGLLTRDTSFPNTPKATFTVAADYNHRLFDVLDMTARVDYAHQSRIDYAGLEFSPNSIQEPYGLLNARVTFEHRSSGVSVSLFGTNLTDETYITAATDDAPKPNPGLGFSVLNQGSPREYGMSLQWRY